MAEHKNIHDAVLAIAQKGPFYLRKADRNTMQNYNYVSEGDFLEKMQPLLTAEGIICFPNYEVIREWDFATKNGGVMQAITLRGTFTFTHAPSGTSLQLATVGQGTDQQDKAAYKAMTGAQKYAIRQLFWIETGDDPEKTKSDESGAAEPSPRPLVAKTSAASQTVPPKDLRFAAALAAESGRTGDLHEQYVSRWLRENGHPRVDAGFDLMSLNSDSRKALIDYLKVQPPF